MSVEKLLDRLSKVKKTGPGQWVACCPSHDDRTPSLAIRETDEGLVKHRQSGIWSTKILKAPSGHC